MAENVIFSKQRFVDGAKNNFRIAVDEYNAAGRITKAAIRYYGMSLAYLEVLKEMDPYTSIVIDQEMRNSEFVAEYKKLRLK